MSLRIWNGSSNDEDIAWDVPGRIARAYSQDVVEVRDSNDLPHLISKRSGSRNVIGVRVNVPWALLAQENEMTLTTALAGDNNDVVYTAKESWRVTQGNRVSITYSDPGLASQSLSVSVTGRDIVVSLATGGGGAITSTADLVKAAIVSESDADDLVSSADSGTNDGSGIVTAMAKSTLSGTSLRTQMKSSFVTRADLIIFDTNEMSYYQGKIMRLDEQWLDNETFYPGDVKPMVGFNVVLTADGVYSDIDDITSISVVPRP